MRPIEVLLSVLFPILIAVGLTMASVGTTPLEFTVAKIGFVFAAIDVAGLVVWWVCKHDQSIWQYALAVAIFAIIAILLPLALMWVGTREEAALKKPAYAGTIAPKDELLFSDNPRIVNRSIEIGDSGIKFGSLNFQGSRLLVELVDGKAKISSEIRAENGDVIARIVRNQWQAIQPKILDRNYNDDSLEVINSKGRIVLQIRVLPDTIQIQGEWWGANGYGDRVLKTSQGGVQIIGLSRDSNPDEPAIQPMFLYPSELHFGELRK
jgi:hypothetical protein